jgi:hypothetical protein
MAFVNDFDQWFRRQQAENYADKVRDKQNAREDSKFAQQMDLRNRELENQQNNQKFIQDMETKRLADAETARQQAAQMNTAQGIAQGLFEPAGPRTDTSAVPGPVQGLTQQNTVAGPPGQQFNFGAGPVVPVPAATRNAQALQQAAAAKQAEFNQMMDVYGHLAKTMYPNDPNMQNQLLRKKLFNVDPDKPQTIKETIADSFKTILHEKGMGPALDLLNKFSKATSPASGAQSALAGAEIAKINQGIMDKKTLDAGQQAYAAAVSGALPQFKNPNDPNMKKTIAATLDAMLAQKKIKPEVHAAAYHIMQAQHQAAPDFRTMLLQSLGQGAPQPQQQ